MVLRFCWDDQIKPWITFARTSVNRLLAPLMQEAELILAHRAGEGCGVYVPKVDRDSRSPKSDIIGSHRR